MASWDQVLGFRVLGFSFEQFMVMLRADSRDSLDQYDDRTGGSSHGGAPQGLGVRVEP